MKCRISPLAKLDCFRTQKHFNVFTFSQGQTGLRVGQMRMFHLLELLGVNPGQGAQEVTGGIIASYSSRLTCLELAILALCIWILFSKTTFSNGPSVMQVYLTVPSALLALAK